jgi:hypothetical protein
MKHFEVLRAFEALRLKLKRPRLRGKIGKCNYLVRTRMYLFNVDYSDHVSNMENGRLISTLA